MCSFQIFLSVDSPLGRVDYGLMSDQFLMEMLIDGFDDETKKHYQDNDGMYLNLCKWSCTECDDDERVIEIRIGSCSASGSLELCYVPPKVKFCSINSFGNSKLTGSVDLTQLPEGMRHLHLNNNQLTGEIDLTHLPDEMKELFLQNNQLTGEIDLTRLPGCLRNLYLNNNQITGSLDLTNLPDGMLHLYLDNNRFGGSFIAKNLPPRLVAIYAGGNLFSAVAFVESQTRTKINLKGSGVRSVVDENGKERVRNVIF